MLGRTIQDVTLRFVSDDIDLGRASDGELLRLATKGDSEAWDELVARFQGLLARVAHRNGVPYSDAEDVAQATWIRLWQSADQIRDPERLAGWLATTAHRESVKVAMRLMRQTPLSNVELDSTQVVTGSGHDPALRSDRDHDIERAVASLPPKYRLLIELMVSDEDLSYAEMARALRVPVGSIGPMRLRSLGILRRTLSRTYSSGERMPKIRTGADVGRGRDVYESWDGGPCTS